MVVVNAASPVTMDWADDVAAVVQLGYLGQETGPALAAVLFGDADASGRLTTTLPRAPRGRAGPRNFPGADGTVDYAEGIFVGYRHYDTNGVDPRWCFGHGLSYTTFAYSALAVDRPARRRRRRRRGVGRRHQHRRPGGSEVVQVYVGTSMRRSSVPTGSSRASRRSTLDPGETATVTVVLDERAFAYWDVDRAVARAGGQLRGSRRILVRRTSAESAASAVLSLGLDRETTVPA